MSTTSPSTHTILLTFDVEDWFQVENFKECIPYSSWSSLEMRVQSNTIALLDLLDTAPFPLKATFFTLGWIAQRLPGLVVEIAKRGHEVASHGYNHKLCSQQNSVEIYNDLCRSKKLLEDIIGQEVTGYRAPSFSISNEALALVKKAGYGYDSSYNSFDKNGRYGTLKLPDDAKPSSPAYRLAPAFYEIPVSNLLIGDRIIPWAGGGYFRILPYFIHRLGVHKILKQTGCYTFYLHPWEIDPSQPRVKNAKALFRFRHYINLGKTKDKLSKFIKENANCNFNCCADFIKTRQNGPGYF